MQSDSLTQGRIAFREDGGKDEALATRQVGPVMFLLLPYGLAVCLPFLVERFYLKRRFGPFALLFGLFVVQVTILLFAMMAAEQAGGGTLGRIGGVIAAIVVWTIWFPPLASLAFAILISAVWGLAYLFPGSKAEK